MASNPTAVGAIALPTSMVTLSNLKTVTGEPVVVKVEFVDQLTMTRIVGLPGTGPTPTDISGDSEAIAVVEKVASIARPLIQHATVLVDDDGSEVRPAFWFDENCPRHPKSLPGRFLSVPDLTSLCMEILRVSGFVGGASSEAEFPDENRGGDAASVVSG